VATSAVRCRKRATAARSECQPLGGSAQLGAGQDLEAQLRAHFGALQHHCSGPDLNCRNKSRVLKAKRQIEHDEPAPTNETVAGERQSDRRTEPIFMMRIRANKSAADGSPTDAQPPSVVANGSAVSGRQDYEESVKPSSESPPPPGSGLVRPALNEPTAPVVPAGMLGIPSIEPETIEDLAYNINNDRLDATVGLLDTTPVSITTTTTTASAADVGPSAVSGGLFQH
jgi:hypothetical protein